MEITYEQLDSYLKDNPFIFIQTNGITIDKILSSLENGELFAVVRMNGKLISKPYFGSTSVEEGAVIEGIPLISGG